MSNPSEWWMVTIPNEKNSAEATFSRLQSAVAPFASAVKWESPLLKIGTLDTLMSLSDELGKHDTSIENVIRKIERQYTDMAGAEAQQLTVNGAPPQRYLETFSWDVAKYSKRRTLPELVALILSGAGSVDEELKQLTVNLQEANQRLTALVRKKGGNLLSNPIEEYLKPEMMTHFKDTEYLKTVCVVVPKTIEQEFTSTYHTIGEDIAGYGGPDWSTSKGCGDPDNHYGPFCDRRKVTGSPVVPGSAMKLLTEGEHVLYTIIILKGQYEAGYLDEAEPPSFKNGNYVDFMEKFRLAAREKRFTVRDFKPSDKTVDAKTEVADLEIQVAEKQASLERWCRTHFGEAFSAWIHLKVIRAFVESVLRYGITPVAGGSSEQQSNFVLAALKVAKNKAPQLKGAVDKLMNVDAAASAAAAEDGEEGEYHPYCKLEFTVS